VVYGCGSCKYGQLPGNVSRMSPERTVAIPIKLHLPFHPRHSSRQEQQQQAGNHRVRAPVVHQLVAGGNSSVFLTRGPEEIPEVYSINLLEK
jgi:hypothetical protein